MSDIIRLLPDSVANQIAAGEVIQRPASVVKELMENSIDASADKITVNIKDAGKTLIQVTDNGKGMSETDARMAFERHATSKIRFAEDLFSIKSMGFRGEALASIAAVADVELKTKQTSSDLGTHIHIKGSQLISQETISCENGSNFLIKNLFFNIPARRKFLKKETTEFKHITNEFKKIALANPEISFELYHNDKTIFKLPKEALINRITGLFGKFYLKKLITINSKTEFLKITGYTGTPETAKKRNDDQYFFVNNRFMRHSYLYKAILSAYEKIIKPDTHPSFFIYFDIDPEQIDINIHPAKIQINFQDTHGVFQSLRATVKQALGMSNIMPSIDFDTEGAVEIPYFGNQNKKTQEPEIYSNSGFNPFNEEAPSKTSFIFRKNLKNEKKTDYRDELIQSFESKINFENENDIQNTQIFKTKTDLFQFKKKYIVSYLKSGIIIIHITRANERIMFEELLEKSKNNTIESQKILHPTIINLSEDNIDYIKAADDTLKKIGFEIEYTEKDEIIIKALPYFLASENHKEIIENILIQVRDDTELLEKNALENIAQIIARKNSAKFAKTLAEEELQETVNKLFQCQNPNYTYDGRKIIHKIDNNETDSFFK